MSRRAIVFLLLTGTILLGVALWRMEPLQPFFGPSDIGAKGDAPDPMVTYATLATSIVSLVTAVVGLIKASLDTRKAAAEASKPAAEAKK